MLQTGSGWCSVVRPTDRRRADLSRRSAAAASESDPQRDGVKNHRRRRQRRYDRLQSSCAAELCVTRALSACVGVKCEHRATAESLKIQNNPRDRHVIRSKRRSGPRALRNLGLKILRTIEKSRDTSNPGPVDTWDSRTKVETLRIQNFGFEVSWVWNALCWKCPVT